MFDIFKTKLSTSRQVQTLPYIVVLICFAAVFIRFPGEWDSDTESQHAQMLAGQYRDWHPPLFAAFWRLVNGVWNTLTGMGYDGSGVLYMVHALMLWGGLALMVRAARTLLESFIGKEQWKMLVLLAFLLFFGLFEMAPMTRFVFKDTAMMSSYILALGIMTNMPDRRLSRIAAGLACLLLLFYGTGVRHNAIFALLPLLGLLVLRIRPGLRLRWALPAVLLLWAGLLAGVQHLTYEVLKAKKEYSLQEIIFNDYWRINYATRTFEPPPLPGGQSWNLNEDIFFRFYNENTVYIRSSFRFVQAYYGQDHPLPLRYEFSNEPGDFERLKSAWLDKIQNNLGEYIDIRKRIFVDLLRSYSFMGLSGAVYFILALLISMAGTICLLRKVKFDPAPFLVASSGLLYVLPYLVAVPATERRYLYWFFFSTFFGLGWLAIRRVLIGLKQAPSPAPTNPHHGFPDD